MTHPAFPLVLVLAVLAAGCVDQPPPPSPLPDPGVPVRLRAVGTEPFWAATVTPGRLTYLTPENQAGVTTAVQRSDAAGTTVFTGQLGGGPLRMQVTVGTCSDGMSDTVYPFTVELLVGGEQRRGCAQPAAAAQP